MSELKYHTKRIESIDALRGFAIFMVVFSHIATHISQMPSLLCDVCIRWRMPLFFFISGFLIHSLMIDANKLKAKVKNRLTKQLYPTLVVFFMFVALSSYISETNLTDCLYDALFAPMKYGYWFTISLVEVFISFAVLSYILVKYSCPLRYKKVMIAIFCILLVVPVYLLEGDGLGHGVIGAFVDLFCMVRTLKLAFFFYLGVLCGLYSELFIKIVSNKIFTLSSIAIFVFCYLMEARFFFVFSEIAGVFAVITIFVQIHNLIPDNKAISYLKTIGKLTLPIYLFHYFIIVLLQNIPRVSESLKFASQYPIIEFMAFTMLAVIIIRCSLLIDKVLAIKPTIHKMIFNVHKF